MKKTETVEETKEENDIVMEDKRKDIGLPEEFVKGVLEELKKAGDSEADKLEFTTNEKGSLTLKSTGNALLDFFATCGSMRGDAKKKDLVKLFLRSLLYDPKFTIKCIFYMRDVRGGCGERDCFRTIMRVCSGNEFLQPIVKRNMGHIPEYGRYDDIVYSFEGTPLFPFAMELIKKQLEKDIESEKPSLLGKWMPSENTSSKNTKRLASLCMKELSYPPKKYRKTLSALRKKISIVERKMSAKQFNKIQYDKIPSLAFKKYNKAFAKRDKERYEKFLEDVKKGKKTVNTATLFPYDIVRNFLFPKTEMTQTEIETMNVLWDKLPEYLPEGENNIVVCDVSGSMFSGAASVQPICVAISLAMYIGERMPLNGFITFHQTPEFVEIKGKSLKEKIDNIKKAAWGMNTNLQAVFDLVLTMQMKAQFSPEQQIKKIFIISDMQFDNATRSNNTTNFQEIQKKYDEAGFERPSLVFWNVNSGSAGFQVASDETNTFLVSGCSPNILSTAMTSDPTTFMMNVLNGERYKKIEEEDEKKEE